MKVGNRESIPVEMAFVRPELTAWIYNPEDKTYGLDPWTKISGIDYIPKTDQYILQFGQAAEIIVDRRFLVYVSEKF